MRKILLILKHELLSTLLKPGFLVLSFGLPMLGAVIFMLVSAGDTADSSDTTPGEGDELLTEGYVDHAGLIQELPDGLPPGVLLAYPDESAARAALQRGEIDGFYLIGQDYLQTGEVRYVHPSRNPLSQQDQDWVLRLTVVHALFGEDASLSDWFWDPIDLRESDLSAQGSDVAEACSRPGAGCESNAFIRLIPTIVVVFFFIALTNGSALLLRGVGREKQNRVMEVIASSVSPQQLMAGKIAGLGIAVLLAFATWMGLGAFMLRNGRQPLNLPPGFSIPPGFLAWSLVFFLFGFGLYASLMAGLGALVPNMKETTGAAWVAMAPLLVGYMVAVFGYETPNSPLMTGLSLFPLTSPLVMVQRLSIAPLPAWQPPLAAFLLVLTVLYAIRVAGRLFRAHNLLSGQPFSPKRFLVALVG